MYFHNTLCLSLFRFQSQKRTFDEQLIDCLKPQSLDEYDIFGTSVAAKIKKLNEKKPKAALEAQKRINDILYEFELDVLTGNSE
jgi:hypothetical protein